MSRFYVKPEDVKGSEIIVSKEEGHHIADVMRMTTGDGVVAFDGTGREYIGRISEVAKDTLKIKIEKINEVAAPKKVYISLAQALPKKAKMDMIVEKATELGADEICPLITERTIVKINEEKRDDKKERWQTIAVSASKQCGRLSIPQVRLPVLFDNFLKEIRKYDLAMMACLDNRTKPIKDFIPDFKVSLTGRAAKRIMIMVGPEGDFSPREIGAASAEGAKLISLGRLVLKSDTAGLYLLSVLNYENSGV